MASTTRSQLQLLEDELPLSSEEWSYVEEDVEEFDAL